MYIYAYVCIYIYIYIYTYVTYICTPSSPTPLSLHAQSSSVFVVARLEKWLLGYMYVRKCVTLLICICDMTHSYGCLGHYVT